MFRATFVTAALAAAFLMTACGTSSHDSRETTRTGVSPNNGYPGGPSKDPESPALASSTETAHSNPIPKVPEADESHEGKEKASHEGTKGAGK